MMNKDCTEGVTLEALLQYPVDLLVLQGAEDDDDETDRDGKDDDDEDGDDDSDDDRDGDDEDEDKDKPKPGDPDRKLQNLEEDRNRQQKKRVAAETRAQDLERQINELKANGTQDEALKKEVQEKSQENEQLRDTNRQLSLQNAFLSDNAYEWQDAKAALKLADLSDVEIGDDGAVEGMKVALDKLAKSSPYLLKKTEPAKPSGKRSGSQPTPRSKQTDSKRKTREAELKNKYPALRK